MKRLAGALLALAMLSGEAHACLHSPKARAAFKRLVACPATGKHAGACPGFIIDHVQPLCAGGKDSPDNMQWQTVSDAKAKDRIERQQCITYRARSHH